MVDLLIKYKNSLTRTFKSDTNRIFITLNTAQTTRNPPLLIPGLLDNIVKLTKKVLLFSIFSYHVITVEPYQCVLCTNSEFF